MITEQIKATACVALTFLAASGSPVAEAWAQLVPGGLYSRSGSRTASGPSRIVAGRKLPAAISRKAYIRSLRGKYKEILSPSSDFLERRRMDADADVTRA